MITLTIFGDTVGCITIINIHTYLRTDRTRHPLRTYQVVNIETQQLLTCLRLFVFFLSRKLLRSHYNKHTLRYIITAPEIQRTEISCWSFGGLISNDKGVPYYRWRFWCPMPRCRHARGAQKGGSTRPTTHSSSMSLTTERIPLSIAKPTNRTEEQTNVLNTIYIPEVILYIQQQYAQREAVFIYFQVWSRTYDNSKYI